MQRIPTARKPFQISTTKQLAPVPCSRPNSSNARSQRRGGGEDELTLKRKGLGAPRLPRIPLVPWPSPSSVQGFSTSACCPSGCWPTSQIGGYRTHCCSLDSSDVAAEMERGVQDVCGRINPCKQPRKRQDGHRKKPNKASAGCLSPQGALRYQLQLPSGGSRCGSPGRARPGVSSSLCQWAEGPPADNTPCPPPKGPGWHPSVANPSTWSKDNLSLWLSLRRSTVYIKLLGLY